MAARGLDAGLRGREGFCCKTHMLVYGQGSGDFWGVSHNLALLCKTGSICTFNQSSSADVFGPSFTGEFPNHYCNHFKHKQL